MKVEIIKCLEDNFSYILINEANRNCCVVDPGEADPIINLSLIHISEPTRPS